MTRLLSNGQMGLTSHASRAAPPPPPTATATWELALTSPFLDLLAGCCCCCCCIVEPRRPSQSREARGNKSSHAPHGLACQPPPSLPSLPPTETQPLAHTRKSDDQRTQPTTRGGADPDPKMLAAGGSRGGVPCAAAPALVAVALLALSAVAAADFFSPLAPIFSPVTNSICSTVACGQGNCTVAPGTLGYRCDCRPGWTQLHVGDSLRFLPCVIPNCSIDSSCSSGSPAPAPALALTPLPAPKNFSPACELAYCGAGSTCRKNGSGLSYHCECKEGYSNLLSMTMMPCFQNCSFGPDCASIGIHPSSNSPPAPPGSESISNQGDAAAPGSISQQILLPLLVVISLAVGQAI